MTRNVLGAVLAGGRSRRMGRDKALLRFAGRTLAERAVSTLEEVFGSVVLIGDVRPELGGDLEAVPDLLPDRGPLGGLVTALERGAGRDVFLLACDLPLVEPDLVRHVVAAGAGASFAGGAYVAAMEGRVQPLCGLYAASCRGVAADALRAGRLRMTELLERLDSVPVAIDDSLSFYHPLLLHNVNRPEDYEALGAAAHGR